MKNSISALLLSGLSVIALAGCSGVTGKKLELDNAHYWQRSETSSAIYQRGPKAQQMLHRDIAECTYEVRELDRLGPVRAAMPADTAPDGTVPDPATPAGKLAGWDTPEREGYLLTEHSDFQDFETCMMTKGWERVEYLPYDMAIEAREDYVEAITGEQRRSKMETPEAAESKQKSSGLNE